MYSLPYPCSFPESPGFCQQLWQPVRLPLGIFLSTHMMMKDTSWQRSVQERQWANPWKKNPARPIKYKDISHRLLGKDSRELSHSACPSYALCCRQLVSATMGDWIWSEMDFLGDPLKSSLCSLVSCSQVKCKWTKRHRNAGILSQNSDAAWVWCRQSVQQNRFSA